MANVVAQGISRKKIRAFTKYVRELSGMTDRLYFPVVEFLEIILPNLIDDFTYEIVEHSEMPDKEGETIPSLNTIKIREDVYEKATQGDGRARFTILHEVGHLLMHDNDRVALCRKSDNAPLKAYCGQNMFKNCSALTKAPDLPSTEIAAYCYAGMF